MNINDLVVRVNASESNVMNLRKELDCCKHTNAEFWGRSSPAHHDRSAQTRPWQGPGRALAGPIPPRYAVDCESTKPPKNKLNWHKLEPFWPYLATTMWQHNAAVTSQCIKPDAHTWTPFVTTLAPTRGPFKFNL